MSLKLTFMKVTLFNRIQCCFHNVAQSLKPDQNNLTFPVDGSFDAEMIANALKLHKLDESSLWL